MTLDDLTRILRHFNITIQNVSFQPIHQGLINDTFLVFDNTSPLYIMQHVNTNVFKDYQGLHHNLQSALQKLKTKDYQSITLIKTHDNQPYAIIDKQVWRLQSYIPNSIAHNFATNNGIAYEAGRILGRFHSLLKDENLEGYKTTIVNFNHLPFRIDEFKTALNTTEASHPVIAKKEIDFAQKQIPKLLKFYDSDLPLRLCHNDTKLNNFLFNKEDKALCLVDLDTIMSGYFHYDFGDAVRTIVSESIEGEMDISKIKFNLNYFKAFIKGIKASNLQLSTSEIQQLPLAVSLMPFMHGLRALTDYLNGNIYYKVDYDTQNLDRSRSLFHITNLGFVNRDKIKAIINTYFQ